MDTSRFPFQTVGNIIELFHFIMKLVCISFPNLYEPKSFVCSKKGEFMIIALPKTNMESRNTTDIIRRLIPNTPTPKHHHHLLVGWFNVKKKNN